MALTAAMSARTIPTTLVANKLAGANASAAMPRPAQRTALAAQCSRTEFSTFNTSRARRSTVAAASTAETINQTGTVYADFLDEEAMLAASTFPIAPKDLIAKAKAWLANATEGQYDAATMADEFEFVGPVVGPLTKEQFLGAIGGFDLKAGIPDLTGNMHHFRVDPYIHSRVWFTTIAKGTHTGTLAGAIAPTGKAFQSPPQACSLTFNEQGQVIEYTIGYAMDRRLGNTGGLGGVFGIFYAIGKPLPFPEANPWKMSKRYKFFQLIGKINSMMKK